MTISQIPDEGIRNRLLRRVDWRFLLPDCNPANSICFTKGRIEEGLKLISERVCSPSTYLPENPCDLAVATNPSPAILEAAWKALQPGGACYVEWNSPLSGGVKGVKQRLEAAGFEKIECYWPWPWPEHDSPLFWLPLEASQALRYYFNSRPKASSKLRHFIWRLLQLLWLLSLKMNLIFPVCVVARKPGTTSNPSPSGGTSLFEMLRANWDEQLLGKIPNQLSRLLLTGGKRSINKVVALIFVDQEDQPRCIVKLPRVPEALPALKREASVLRVVHSLDSSATKSIPQLLLSFEKDNVFAVCESVLTGQPLFMHLNSQTHRELALKATDWLIQLVGNQPEPQAKAIWWNRLVEPVLAEFSRNFGPVTTQGQLDQTRRLLDDLGSLPLVCEQRDFSPWNLLIAEDGSLVVLDWESAELEGLPVLDLVYFLTYLSFFLDGAMESRCFVESYRAMLDPLTPTGQVFAQCLARYSSPLEIDRAALLALRLLTWMLHSRSEYQHLVADRAGPPDHATLNSSLFFNLWKEELSYIPGLEEAKTKPVHS